MAKHSRSLICDKCGGRLRWERFQKKGKHFRKYSCALCGYKEVYERVKGFY